MVITGNGRRDADRMKRAVKLRQACLFRYDRRKMKRARRLERLVYAGTFQRMNAQLGRMANDFSSVSASIGRQLQQLTEFRHATADAAIRAAITNAALHVAIDTRKAPAVLVSSLPCQPTLSELKLDDADVQRAAAVVGETVERMKGQIEAAVLSGIFRADD